MKIAHVTPFYPPAIGGVETFVYHLAKEQARQGHDVSVITNSLPSAGRRSFVFTHASQELDSVKVYRLSSFMFRMTPVPLSLVSYLSKMDFDIIHLHLSGWIFQPEGTSLMAKVKQIPLVSHVHMDPTSQRSRVAPYRSLSFKLSLALSKAIIVPTDNYKRLMRTKYGEDEKVAVIPNGIDASLFESRAEREPKEEPRLLFVGRLVRQKGLDRLILAMKNVLEQVPNAKLTVVGQSNTIEMEYSRQLMRTVNELNLDDCVTFLGELSNDKLQEIRSKATLFIAPSRYESFGIVLLEAMASGLPVVASDIPEFKEIARGSALLVDPSPENLSKAIVRTILDKNLREKMIESARKRARDFLWPNIAQQVLSLYALQTSRSP